MSSAASRARPSGSRRRRWELFQTTPQNITQHLREIYAEGEFDEAATCKPSLQVRTEGTRQVSRSLRFYSLDAILAVGFRVRSHRGTQFRRWANARLSEYLVNGFTMDDERLKNPPGPGHTDYFDELLERIRDIRASERRFYQKVLDIYATSIDYQPDAALSERFFATVQNKMHWAAHGHTAAEIVHDRADGERPFMGMQTTRPGGVIRKGDAAIAMTMRDWVDKLDDFLKASAAGSWITPGPSRPRSRRRRRLGNTLASKPARTRTRAWSTPPSRRPQSS